MTIVEDNPNFIFFSPHSGAKSKSSNHRGYHYLQKTMPGGILLLEIGFKHVYFFVNVYAYECSRLPIGKTVSQHVSYILIFLP